MNEINCDVIKYSYRQNKDGHVIGFVIHPNDVSLDLANAPIGSQWRLVLRELDEDGNPVT